MNTKTVAFPIKVPEDEYCWNWETSSCEHFDNEGGHETCNLNFWKQKRTDKGVLKPKECLNLKEIKNDT